MDKRIIFKKKSTDYICLVKECRARGDKYYFKRIDGSVKCPACGSSKVKRGKNG